MPKKFSEFFTLNVNKADEFQKRLYKVIENATTIVDCYRLIYEYIIGGLKWQSRKYRHDKMDNKVDTKGLNEAQMNDAVEYFEGSQLGAPIERVRFEYLVMVPQDSNTYGPNVFILRFDENQKIIAKTALRQVQLYLNVEIYNKEYDKQVAYRKKHTGTKPLKIGKIKIDPASDEGRINPDSEKQKDQLIKFVDKLVTWVKENYQDVKAVLAVKNAGELYKLVFSSGKLPADEIIKAVEWMLEMISGVRKDRDSTPSTKDAFRQWVIDELEQKSTFWEDQKISAAYASIEKLKTKNDNPKTYKFFKTLFGDFLSPKPYPGESDDDVKTRRTEALEHISTIFSTFKSGDGVVNVKYESLMKGALEAIQSEYPGRYINNLLQAQEKIPQNDGVYTILAPTLADLLKELADQLLGTLPLLHDKTEVRFFVIPNFEELNALNANNVYVLKGEEARSSVFVKSDPLEDGARMCRPVYRSFRLGTSTDEAIAFCNLPDLASGTFYYRHLGSPAVMRVKATKFFNKIMTIDFQNYTIAYLINNKKKDPTINEHRQPYRSGGSTTNFFDDLKAKTKWTQIHAGRSYDPYYTTDPTDAKAAVPHLTAYMAAGRGASRVLPLRDDTLCVWVWNYRGNNDSTNYEKLGEVLGLPAGRQIIPGPGGLQKLETLNKGCSVQIGDAQYTFVNYGHDKLRDSGYYYSIIGLTPIIGKKKELFYVRVNTPSPGVAAVLTTGTTKKKSRALDADPRRILNLFDFGYYRRITNTTDNKILKPPFREDFKVIQLFAADANNPLKPSGAKVLEWPDEKFVAIGANLPICFNLNENVIKYFEDKKSRGKIINKGNTLYREQKPRKDAGTAMSPIHSKLKPPLSIDLSASKVPATAFARGAMTQSEAVEADWGILKTATGNYLPINQEWCHLRGHGDGGAEYPGNFVSGSYHCNTEQLAIENGQRTVTRQMPEQTFKLHTTAYLLRDADYNSKNDGGRKSQILTGNYLKNEDAYDLMLKKHDERPTKKSKTDNSPAPQQGEVAPLAACLRYKVMRYKQEGMSGGKRLREQETLGKSFDFIFEGQGEFIDLNQSTIISQAVQFALAGEEALKTWYTQAKADLDSNATKKLQQT